jgi:uncharacterized repeat protein (TIGR03803 family)
MKQMFTRTLQTVLTITCLAFMISTTNAQTVLAGLTSNGGAEGKGTAFTIKTDGSNFNVIKTFADWGKYPNGDFYKNSDGVLYGMTNTGGTYNAGTIFKMTTSGVVTIIRHLNGTTDGASPQGELIKGFDGNFYGMTNSGGANTYGTIFKLTPDGLYSVMKNFSYATDGTNPKGHLVQGKDSSFYGITYGGGTYGYGTIFKMTKGGTFSVLRHLNGTTDGGQSYSSLVEGKDGNLYGITYSGGLYKYGTIFKITKGGQFTVMRNLNLNTDGGYPQGDMIQGTDGYLYGMCYSGGTKGNGTIFKIATTTNYPFTVLHNLASQTDGGNPFGVLYQNSDGNLYGMTRTGGANTSGTAFRIGTGGGFALLHSFAPTTEGSSPNGGFVKGNDGNFYGFTNTGGMYGNGTAFRMTSAGNVTVLVSFNGAKFGNTPTESLIKGKDSAYYGTTSIGGAYGYGTVFKICAGVTTTLYSFNRPVTGGTPLGSLIQATDGNFYGTTSDGGPNGYGTIFRISSSGSFAVVKSFTGVADGGLPKGTLVQGRDSLLYGMTYGGGSNAGGVIFKINLTGTKYTVLRHLLYTTDGNNPEGGLIQGTGTDSFFYGMTSNYAKIFKISPNGIFTVLRSLSSLDGSYPYGSLVKHPDGNYYGMTSSGGSSGAGTIFRISTGGSFAVVKNFNGTTEGKSPKGSLLVGPDKNLYGMTNLGGTYSAGTIFRYTPGGAFTTLRQLNLTTDGGHPLGGLIFAPVHNLVATPQSVTTNEDVAKSITLTGTGGSPLAFNIVAAPTKGTISSGTAALRTYTPTKNANGVDSFSFNVSVGCMSSAPVYVKINIVPVADSPVLATIGNKTIKKDSTLTFKATATDADAGQTITYSLIGAPAGATIGSSTGTFTWKPTTTGTFIFKVRATDSGSPALYDEEQITVTVSLTLAAKMIQSTETSSFTKATVYPNPVSDRFYINLSSAADASVQIVDINGKVLTQKSYVTGKNIAMDGSWLKAGAYIVRVQTISGTESFKIIKL